MLTSKLLIVNLANLSYLGWALKVFLDFKTTNQKCGRDILTRVDKQLKQSLNKKDGYHGQKEVIN